MQRHAAIVTSLVWRHSKGHRNTDCSHCSSVSTRHICTHDSHGNSSMDCVPQANAFTSEPQWTHKNFCRTPGGSPAHACHL